MKKSHKILLLFWGTAICLKLIGLFFVTSISSENIFSTLNTFLLSFLLFAWFMADAQEINLKPSYGLKVAVVSISLIAIPYYLVRYKGWQKAFVVISQFLGNVFILFFIFALLTRYINAQ